MNEHDVLSALVDVWVREVAPHVNARCCILAARTTSLVLDYYGIGNKVLACEVFVANEAALALIDQGTPMNEWPEGAWSMYAGDHSPGAGYAGHLVVRTDSGALVDLSAGQFHRHGRIAIDGPRVWRDYTTGDVAYVINEGDVFVRIEPVRDNVYRKATDWVRGREVAALIIRTINNNGRINK